MRAKLIIIFLIITSCACLLGCSLISGDRDNHNEPALPATASTLAIENNQTQESVTVYIDAVKKEIMKTLSTAESIDAPEEFDSNFSLIIDDEEICVEGDILHFHNTYYFCDDMEVICDGYLNNIDFVYKNTLLGISEGNSHMTLQWLHGQPYMDVECDDEVFIHNAIAELLLLQIEEAVDPCPTNNKIILSGDDGLCLEFSQDCIRLGNAYYSVSAYLILADLTLESEVVKLLFEERIRNVLINNSNLCQVQVGDGIWQIPSPDICRTLGEKFTIERLVYGGINRDGDIAKYRIKIDLGNPIELLLELYDSEVIEVNSKHFYIKYDSDLWDYLSKTYPVN